MPPALACKFTVSELAVLRIIGDEVRQHRQCDRCVDELAARAGVCRRMVKNAIREAARLGLLTVEERRREGRRNLPNIVRTVFGWVLALIAERGLVRGERIGVDASTMEANAALRAIVRRIPARATARC